MKNRLGVGLHRLFDRSKHRRGAASLELVMVTAVALPLVLMMFLLAVRMCAYVYQALGGTLLMPYM